MKPRYQAVNATVITAAIAAGIHVLILFNDGGPGPSATDGFAGTWMSQAVAHLSSLGAHAFEVQNEMNRGDNWTSGWAWAGPALWFSWQDSTTDGDFGFLTASGGQKPSYSAFGAAPSP